MAFDRSLRREERGGLCAFMLFILLDKLDVCKFPPANPEDLSAYAWRVHEKETR